MAPPFVFPTNPHELEEETDDNRLSVASLVDVGSLRPSDLEELVKGVVFDLSDRDLFCVEDHDVFDRVYSLVKGFSVLSTSSKYNLVETLRSNLAVLLPNVESLARAPKSSPSNSGIDQISLAERVASHRNALKIYAYFLVTIVLSEVSKQESSSIAKVGGHAPKKNPTNLWNSEVIRGRIVTLIANSLEINLSLVFGTGSKDGSYLSFISKFAFTLYENQHLLKDTTTKDGLGRIIGSIATKHKQIAESSASILYLIYKFDFTVPHLVEAVAAAENKFGDGSLAVALIREIGRTDPKDYARDGPGAENIGRFVVELADRLPKLMSTNIGVLVPHFGGESYKIRNALVGVLGKLAAKAFNDLDGDQSSRTMRLRGKQAMLEILIERCKDISAYTRSRVLQVWAELCEERAVSIGLWNELALIASGRLEDKSAIVRKSALNLLITMLQHNPFGPQLRVAIFQATLEKYKEKLQEIEPACEHDVTADAETASVEGAQEAASGFDMPRGVQKEESASDSCLSSSQDQSQKNASVPDIGNVEQIKALIASLEAGLQFSKCIASTMKITIQLLASSCATDVENTILFLMRSRQFQIDGSEECLLKMLPLVFSQDKSIYEAVENAFVSIYIRKSPSETAQNLLSLTINTNLGDLTALESLISSLVVKGLIPQSTISALWDCFSFNISGVEPAQSRGALSVLCMAAKSSPGILSSHLQDIIDIGFGRWAKVEPLLARTACLALERLSEEDKERLRCNGGKVFGVLKSFLTGFWLPENIWYAAAEKAISTIYSIHLTPEAFAVDLVKNYLNLIFSCTISNEATCQADNTGTNSNSVSASKLGRFLFVTSHIALNHLVHIESTVKKIREEKSKLEKANCDSNVVDDNPDGAAQMLGINEELGIAASDDVIIDSLHEKAEKEILSSSFSDKNLFGYYASFLSKLCRNINMMQKHPELQASAMLALCRLMIVDSDFCQANLQLLFTVIESAQSETVRTNCTVALGDLAVRFPNLLEPWTENIYARLRDPSSSVRKNAVLVLSHLILNDMMKVKGYIDEMSIRIVDKDERISSLSKLFFHELSKKGNNPIYSLLPDILGKLSNQNLQEEVFCEIMQFLINFIKKDKQMEGLVEKLCNRFTGVTDSRQWRCIAYCLSQLSFSERGLKKLIECFKAYEHVLSEDSVMDCFRVIVNKCKKFAKPELKSCIEEFEGMLHKIHVETKEQDETARNALTHQKKAGALGKLVKVEKGTGEDDENNVEEATSEVINPLESEESSISSAIKEHSRDAKEIQSPKSSLRAVCRSKVKEGKQSNVREQKKKDTSSLRSSSRLSRRRGVKMP
ncbi:hypothetical protein HPP92_024744 [Vanilla planifolia]|uniref:Condensin-1 complex subunit CAP-D2 n=1 Tax=Vanilla planifolia TaxID=51239 RepID=A0A835PGK6_VANPL|nr:hypothetical protein HPP92_024744 [Vanilla planifolia]